MTGRAAGLGLDLAAALAAALASLAGAVLVLQCWRAEPTAPWHIGGDGTYLEMLVANLARLPDPMVNPRLGAPFGQELHDYAQSHNALSLWALAWLGRRLPTPAAALNVFYLATFPLAALAAFAALRGLGSSRAVALPVAVLYALLPFRFYRGVSHLFLSADFAVPLAVLLLAWTLSERAPFAGGGTGRAAAAAAIVLLTGSVSAYYAFFAATLLALGALALSLPRRRWANALSGLLAALLVLATLAAGAAPRLAWSWIEGPNLVLRQRSLDEVDRLSLRPAQLLLPIPGHRIAALAQLRARYPVVGEAQELGLAASIGWLWLLWRALPLASRREPDATATLASVNLLALLAAMAGGLAASFAFLVTPLFRAWGRIVPVLAFLALAALAALADDARRRLGLGPRSTLALCGLLAMLAAVEQTSPGMAPDFAAIQARRASVTALVSEVERRLPTGAMVFQLPVVEFPEQEPPGAMMDYDHLLGGLLSQSLRWSYGGVRGRVSEWQQALAERAPDDIAQAAAQRGFHGLWVDRAGFADRGLLIERDLAAMLGLSPLDSSDGRIAFYDLTPLAIAQAEARELLAAVQIVPGEGFHGREVGDGHSWHWMRSRGTLVLYNPGPPQEARLSFSADAAPGGPWQLTVNAPPDRTFELREHPAALAIDLNLFTGRRVVQLSTDAPPVPPWPGDTRDLRVRIVDMVITEVPEDAQ